MNKRSNISGDCQYLDRRREVIIPPHILVQVEILPETTFKSESYNGYINLCPIEGKAIRDYEAEHQITRKGIWE